MNDRRFLGLVQMRELPKKEEKKEIISYDWFCEGCSKELSQTTVLVEVKDKKQLWLCKTCCEKRKINYEDHLM